MCFHWEGAGAPRHGLAALAGGVAVADIVAVNTGVEVIVGVKVSVGVDVPEGVEVRVGTGGVQDAKRSIKIIPTPNRLIFFISPSS
jgi:hypothetical protein